MQEENERRYAYLVHGVYDHLHCGRRENGKV